MRMRANDKKRTKKQAQAAFGRRPARLMKTIGKIEKMLQMQETTKKQKG